METVKIAKTRTGSCFPPLLTPRRRIDVAMHAVVMEAYVHGVSTRKVDDVVTALGGVRKGSCPCLRAAARVVDTDYADPFEGLPARTLEGVPGVVLFCLTEGETGA